MTVGVVTGSGSHALPGFAGARPVAVPTPWGDAEVARGEWCGADVLHVSRHGAGHARLSNHLEHRATAWALRELGASAVVGCTACGAVDPELALGSLVVFDDLHFPSNRLPDGGLCTLFDAPGDPSRAHWVLHGGPFSEGVRGALLSAAAESGVAVRDGGCYGHVDGPRFNTPTEIAALAALGVVAVSQTGGPETVLMGEAAIPYALVGFATDHANGVREPPTPVERLVALMARSTGTFAQILAGALPLLNAKAPASAGTLLRFEH